MFATLIRNLRLGLVAMLPRRPDPEPLSQYPDVDVPVLTIDGHRFEWSVSDAILSTLYNGLPSGRGYTCEEIATNIVENVAIYGHARLSAAQINSAMSGLSIRAKGRRGGVTTDNESDAAAPVHPEAGLAVPWRKRQWQLTTKGLNDARMLTRVRHHKMAYTSKIRKQRHVG